MREVREALRVMALRKSSAWQEEEELGAYLQ